MAGAQQGTMKLPDPLNVHKNKDQPGGGLGLPDPFGLFNSLPPVPEVVKPSGSMPVPPAAPTIADATARVRAQEREAADDARRRRGRRSTIYTGDEGVADTPVGRRTLVGS